MKTAVGFLPGCHPSLSPPPSIAFTLYPPHSSLFLDFLTPTRIPPSQESFENQMNATDLPSYKLHIHKALCVLALRIPGHPESPDGLPFGVH